jgi:CheY-like chemotaxis protein
MKLDYKIIWVEDKIESKPFQALIQNVTKFLEEQFFKVTIETAEDLGDFIQKYDSHRNFDLVVTDLNLNESHGNEVVDYLRDKKHNQTEVFFYSANPDLKTSPLVNSNRITFYQLDGQDYHSELQQNILDLISLTISKFQNIITMRGMIMHETCSLDTKMINIVKQYLEDPANKERSEHIFTSILGNITQHAEEKYNKALAGKMKKILADNVLFSSSHKIGALGEILDVLGVQNFSEEYSSEVISYRNQFAHAELFTTEEGVQHFKARGFNEDDKLVFDEDLCRTIRRNIIKHENNLEKLTATLGH